MERTINRAPAFVGYAPFRAAIHYNWKRQVCRPGPADESYAQTWRTFDTQRRAKLLYRGSWASSYYLVESIVEWAVRLAMLRVLDPLPPPKEEAEDADRFGGSLDLSTAKQTPVSHTKWIFKLLKLLCCLSSFRSQPCHFNARARKKHPVLLVLYHIWTT